MLLCWHRRESGGSLLQHPEGVFLDVEAFALSLAPILNHKTKQKDGRGAHIFGERKLEEQWQLAGRDLLVTKGILLASFARFLWGKPDELLPKQTFDVLVKLGILLPLPRDEPGARDAYSVGGESVPPSADVEEKFLVLMRLPLEAPPETMGRFEAFSQLQEKFWGVAVKWEFDSGSTPHGLVERLIASCHSIGNVVQDTCWRRGACFVRKDEVSPGGSFALALHFLENTVERHAEGTLESTMERQTGGTLVVRAFGLKESHAVWVALRFVISSAWRLFEEFPGLGWEAWVECPYHGQLRHYLAGVKERKVRRIHKHVPRSVLLGLFAVTLANIGSFMNGFSLLSSPCVVRVFFSIAGEVSRRSNFTSTLSRALWVLSGRGVTFGQSVVAMSR